MPVGMVMDWLFRGNRRAGSGDDSLVVRSHGDAYRFSRSGDDVTVGYDGESCALAESGLGGMMATMMRWVIGNETHRLPRGLRMKYFLVDAVVPFACWSGLSAFRFGDAGVDCDGFDMLEWHESCGGYRGAPESFTHCFHFRIPADMTDAMFLTGFFTVGVLLGNDAGGDACDAYLVVDGDFVGEQDWVGGSCGVNRVLIGPFTVGDLVHELRVLCDSGFVEPARSAGLVVMLAEREASRRTGVPRNVVMEDIIDGYPFADDYMMHWS